VTKIAAGEMISRPSSVVKELVENSLDAQSTAIEIRVRERLDRFIEVADDGEGIHPDDLPLALERHATSKIRREEELEQLSTLGFRGEALPSIARVSRLTITTRRRDSDGAWRLTASGEEIGRPEPASRSPGTTVGVEDLFFNTPVRKRSLKSPTAEIRVARQIVQQYALLSLPVRWTFSLSGKSVLDLAPSTDLSHRLGDLFGPDVAASIVPLHYQANLRDGVDGSPGTPVLLEGFIGAPERAKPSPSQQMHFANGRAIVSSLMIQALRQGYGDLLPPGRHPWAVLFITVEPQSLDVNVHPTKREVRFAREEILFREILRAVRQAATAFRPTVGWTQHGSEEPGPGSGRPDASGETSLLPGVAPVQDGETVARTLYGFDERGSVVGEGVEDGKPHLWQLGRRYIVTPRGASILIVDQHAAHERILYERALGKWEADALASQKLLFPEVLEVGEAELEAFDRSREHLERIGFEAEPFGKASLLVRGVPSLSRAPIPPDLLKEILEEMSGPESREGEALERLAKAFACRCAVRSGQELADDEMTQLLRDLFSTEVPHGDPHGRPTYVELRVDELDRRFQRH
jgi:DNA mismatch repair protein MutL